MNTVLCGGDQNFLACLLDVIYKMRNNNTWMQKYALYLVLIPSLKFNCCTLYIVQVHILNDKYGSEILQIQMEYR